MARGATRTLKLTYVGDAKSLLSANAQAEGGLASLGQKFTKFGKVAALGAAAAGAAIGAFTVKFGKDAVAAASDLDESINAVQVTFGEAAEGIRELAEASATTVGLSESQFNSFAVTFAGFTRQIANSDRDIVGVTDDLTTRIADFASVMNLDLDRAAQVFQSTLAGSSEVARAYGIDVSAAAVEQFALANGLVESKSEMTESIKVQARYGLIMQETEKFAGDFANTSDSLANSQRILKARFADVQAEIGKKLVPVIADLVSWVSEKALPFIEKWGKVIADAVGPAVSRLATIIRTEIIPRIVEFVGKVAELLGRFREWWREVGPGVVTQFQRLIDPLRTLWSRVKDLFGTFTSLIGAFRTGTSDGQGFERFIRILVGALNLAIAALTKMVEWVDKVLGAIRRLVESRWFQTALSGLRSIADGLGNVFGGSGREITPPPTNVPAPSRGNQTNITVEVGVGDPEAIAREIERSLAQQEQRSGQPVRRFQTGGPAFVL